MTHNGTGGARNFDDKFAKSSYRECVSSPKSYRHKQSIVRNEAAELEQTMMQNIASCKASLARYEERLQSNEILSSLPALLAVRNFVLRDTERKLRRAWKVWTNVMICMRQIERQVMCRVILPFLVPFVRFQALHTFRYGKCA